MKEILVKTVENQALASIIAFTEYWFSDSLKQFSTQLIEHFSENAETTKETKAQFEYFAALKGIRTSSDIAIKHFLQSLTAHFSTELKNKTLPDNNSSTQKKPLNLNNTNKLANIDKFNLVSETALEENLSFDRAVKRLTTQNKNAFEQVNIQILKYCKECNETLTQAPLTPKNIMIACDDGMKPCNFSSSIRKLSYQLFEQHISLHIPSFLEQLHQGLQNPDSLKKYQKINTKPKEIISNSDDTSEKDHEPLEKVPSKTDGQQGILNLLTNNSLQYHASTEELIAAIRDIQLNNSYSSQQSIHQQVCHTILSQNNQDIDNTQLSSNKIYLINLAEEKFNQITRNKNIPSITLEFIRSLKLPFVHITLVDEQLINNPDHPAILFLNYFATICSKLTESAVQHSDRLYLKLKQISELMGRQEQLSGVFFNKLYDHLEQFIRTETEQQQALLSPQIEEQINQIISQSTRGKNIPKDLSLIINNIWKKVMLARCSQSQCDHDSKEQAGLFLNSLILSISPVKNTIEKKRLEHLIPVVMQEFEKGMDLISLSAPSRKSIMHCLHGLHQTALHAADLIEKNKETQTNQPSETDLENDTDTDTEQYEVSVEDELMKLEIQLLESEAKIESSKKSSSSVSKPVERTESLLAKTDKISETPVEKQKASLTDFELVRFSNETNTHYNGSDKYSSLTHSLSSDTWLNFSFGKHYSKAKITWISDDKQQFHCLTNNEHFVELSFDNISHAFRQGICTIIADVGK